MSHESDEKAPQSAERVQGVAEQGMDWGKALAAAENRADRAEAERDAALAKVARVLNWLEVRDVKYPERFGRTPSENYVKGYTAARVSLRAALADEEPG